MGSACCSIWIEFIHYKPSRYCYSVEYRNKYDYDKFFAIPTRLGHQYLIPVIFIVTAVLEYFVFKKLILKLNIPTLGREGSEVVSEPVLDSIVGNSDSGFEPQIQNIVAGLGGSDNIESIINCYTRLRVDVKDENKVDIKVLKEKVDLMELLIKVNTSKS